MTLESTHFASKFRPLNEQTLQLIELRTLYFAKPGSFNDPFDCDLDVIAQTSPSKLSSIFEECISESRLRAQKEWQMQSRYTDDRAAYDGYGKRPDLFRGDRHVTEHFDPGFAPSELEYRKKISACAKKLNEMAQSGAANYSETVGTLYREISDLLRNQFGILCLARNLSSTLLWSHYADNHRGLALCFNIRGRIFVKQSGIVHRDVEYSGDRAIDATEIGWKKSFTSLFTRKAPEWGYEHETRYLSFRGPGPRRFKRDALHGIILGCRFLENLNKDKGYELGLRLFEIIKKENLKRPKGAKLRLYQASKMHGSFTVKLDEIRDVRVLLRAWEKSDMGHGCSSR